MSDNLSMHCHSWLRPTEVLTAEVEMLPPDRVLYFNQKNNYTGMFTIMFNSIISVNTSPHDFLSAALKCYNTFNPEIGPGLSTLLGQDTVWWGGLRI